VTFAACGGDDSSGGGSTTDSGTPDTSQGDTGTDSGPGIDAAHDSAADGAADTSTDSPTTDGPVGDGNVEASGDDGGDGGEAAAPVVVDCPSGTTPTATVTVGPNGTLTFAPALVTIAVGDTVQWTWASGGHSVTSVSSACNFADTFCSPNDMNCAAGATSDMGATYCQKFLAAGTYDYACVPHCQAGMRGSVVVTP